MRFDFGHLLLSSPALYPCASSPCTVSHRHLNYHVVILYWFLDLEDLVNLVNRAWLKDSNICD